MAASGIAEHNEARRKAMLMEKRAYKNRAMAEGISQRLGNNPELIGMSQNNIPHDTYEEEVNQIRKVGSPPGIGSRAPHDVDQRRRNELRQQKAVEYSAKIPNRYTSVDYKAQW